MEAPPDLECGVAPLGPPAPTQLPLLGHGVLLRNLHILYAGQEATVRAGHGTNRKRSTSRLYTLTLLV